MKIRTPYTRERTLTPIEGPTMAQQQFKDECDINNIMAKYQKTGLITHVAKYQGDYQDFTIMPDFKTAMDTMHNAQEMFLTIPSDIRAIFNNDPGEFVEFATNPDNLQDMIDLGLAPGKKTEQMGSENNNPQVVKPDSEKSEKKASAKKAETPDQ